MAIDKPVFNWTNVPNLLVGGNDCVHCNSPYVTEWVVSVNPNDYRYTCEGVVEWLHKITWHCEECGGHWRGEYWLKN